jgi:hypothetical protein
MEGGTFDGGDGDERVGSLLGGAFNGGAGAEELA